MTVNRTMPNRALNPTLRAAAERQIVNVPPRSPGASLTDQGARHDVGALSALAVTSYH
jgi:hypothetical protein